MNQWLAEKWWRMVVVGILVTVTPIVLLIVFVSSVVQRHVTAQVITDNLQTAKLVASRIEERLASDTGFARAYAARPYLVAGLQRGDKKELDKHLKNLIENNPNIERAFITSPAGIMLAAYPGDQAPLGKDFSKRDWYQGVSKDWQPYISEFYLRAARPQRYLFAIAVPIKAEEGAIRGILVLQPKADYLEEIISQTPADGQTPQIHAYVVDSKGRVIYHSELKTVDSLVGFSERHDVQQLQQGKKGAKVIFCSIHNEAEIIAYTPIPKIGWGVVNYSPQHRALAPLRHLVYVLYGFAGLMILMAGFLSFRGAGHFAKIARLNRELAKKEAAEKTYSDFLAMLNLRWTKLEELSETAVRELCKETSAEAGILYLSQDGFLVAYTAFGVPKPLLPDGLAQACLAQGQTINLTEIPPESHLTLHTGAGSFAPREILAVPLQYQDETIGILELACIHDLGKLDREIAERIAPRLAIALQILSDNLEKERISEELAKANEEMQAANEELTAQQQELSLLNLRLEQASRAKSDFLSNMSHELRTPLNSILGFSGVLLEQMFGDLNEKQQEYIQYILTSGRHLLSLINDILDLAKVEAGKMSLETNNFPLKSLLESSLNMFKEKTIKHGIALELDLDSALAEALIEADERKLKQILFNLLSNAVKFTFDGGVVRLKAEREGEFFKITVTDTGIGIKPEDLGRLFQSFAQLESTYAKQYEGTGLGLALTKKLVELHGGRIWVKSEEGKGSSFIFTIPARPSGQGQQIPETKQQESGRISVKTALVIEDDPLAAQIVETALIFAGFTVTKAVNGRDGLAIAQENSPGLIILDLMLPEMNGFKALAALRAMKETATTPVIVLTAMELSEAEKDGLLAQGVQAVLKKGSLNREEFIATVKRVTG